MTDLRRGITVVCTLPFLLILFLSAAGENNGLEPYLIPWEYESIADTARSSGELHFFFMAGEGYPVNPGSNSSSPDVWGDSCLIAFPNGELMLIDAGMPDYEPILRENLKRLGVSSLDYLVISHPHSDHAGSIYAEDSLLDHISVTRAFTGGVGNSDWADPFRVEHALEAHGVPLQTVYEGFSLEIGDVTLRVLSPSPDIAGKSLSGIDTLNNNSVVLRMDYRDFSALFTGDIYKAKEWELVKNTGKLLDTDLLKMPHHGRATSNSREFAEAVSPVIAVATGRVTVAGQQYYVYSKLGAKVLFDYCDGYIHVWTDGKEIFREQSRERETTYYDKYEANP